MRPGGPGGQEDKRAAARARRKAHERHTKGHTNQEQTGAPDDIAGQAGSAGGRILMSSTLGSLVGTFATTYWLVPILGLRWTFALASALLACAAGLFAWRSRACAALRLPCVLLLVACGGAAFALPKPDRAAPDGVRVLAEVQSAYQWLRVFESGEGAQVQRRLVVNEAFDSFQSLWRPEPGWLGGGSYYDGFAAPFFGPRKRWRAGGRSQPRFKPTVLAGFGPRPGGIGDSRTRGRPAVEVQSVGIEIDPEVVRLGREFFDLAVDSEQHQVFAGVDARHALASLPKDFDQIIVDAYANNVEIPPHLCTVEFFQSVAEHLAPGGWITANLSGFGPRDPVIRAVTHTLHVATGEPVLLRGIAFSRNSLAFVRKGAALPDAQAAQRLPEPLRQLFVPGNDSPLDHREPLGTLLTDDHAPILDLERRSVAFGIEGWLRAAQEAQPLMDAKPIERAMLDQRYREGDMVGTLVGAEALANNAVIGDPYAPYMAARLAVDLDLPQRAQEHLEGLRARLAQPSSDLDGATRAWYQRAATDLEVAIDQRLSVSHKAATAVQRARWTVYLGALLALLGLAWVSLGRSRWNPI